MQQGQRPLLSATRSRKRSPYVRRSLEDTTPMVSPKPSQRLLSLDKLQTQAKADHAVSAGTALRARTVARSRVSE